MGKGETACNEQFLSHSVFRRLVLQTHKDQGLFEKGLTLYQTKSLVLMSFKKKPFENIVGKGENAGNQHFVLFHNVFYPIKDRDQHLSCIKVVISNSFNLVRSKILLFGTELTLYHTILTFNDPHK